MERTAKKEESGWSVWYPLNKDAVRDKAPTCTGVYRIRKAVNPLGRLRGSSDILYIGRAKGLKGRILQILTPGAPHIAEPRIRKLQSLGISLEFAFLKTESEVEVERKLLIKYEEEHLELPPLNHMR